MNIPQTNASERMEAARTALSEWDDAYDGVPADLIDTDELSLASALRALITPPNVAESAEEVAKRLTESVMTYAQMEGLTERGVAMAGIRYGFRAGIQAAHETWEPADHPSQEMMLRWLGLDFRDGRREGTLFIPAQYIEREED